jgi:hypothetical protein
MSKKKNLKPTGNWLNFNCIKESDADYFFNEKLGDVNNPCYRLVLSHAFCKYLDENYFKMKNIGYDEIENRMNLLKKYYGNIEQAKESFYWKHFIEIIPIPGADSQSDKGCVFVDRTGGTFPLVMYPPRQGKGLRSHAFGYAIRDFADRWGDILYEQKEQFHGVDPVKDWMSFKKQIIGLFKYPEKNHEAA